MKSADYFKTEGAHKQQTEQNATEIDTPFLEPTQEGVYKIKGFDVNRKLADVKGPLVEVAGPTVRGFEFVDMEQLPREIHISNLYPGIRTYDVNTGEFIKFRAKVDFRADGKNLPLSDGSVGAIFISCLGMIRDTQIISKETPEDEKIANQKLKEQIIKEVYRVLENGGIFILERIEKEYAEKARKIGFKLKQYKLSEEDKQELEGNLVELGSFVFEKGEKEMQK